MRVVEHPRASESGLPFIELSAIQVGNRLKSSLVEEVIACSPVEVGDGRGRGSYFNTVYELDGRVFVCTMMGRSDHQSNVWVYAGDKATELGKGDPNYIKAKHLLKKAA